MINHMQDVQKTKECIHMLLESHRELLSGDEIEALENAVVMLDEHATSIDSETQKDEIKSLVIEVLAFIARVMFKFFSEE